MEQMDHSSFTVTARLPIGKDEFAISVYSDPRTRLEHIVLVLGSVGGPTEAPVFVRIHSECITGDLFGSKRCDCGAQLEEAVRIISARKRGILIYLRQEGRGIGLVRKLRAYNLQDEGLDTVEANLALGHLPDERSFAAAAEILSILDVEKIELFTNNPAKVSELAAAGTNIVSVIHSSPAVTPYNRAYIKTKIDKLGHVFAQSRVLDDLA
ncbi:MAG TPA: GTP cyclohydrolase II [Dongiaceae bacterium]|jgi:3,4-dihydroxy 2-butanone 4-phosphate synthase/GTP cyclohydrolase II|nr:GTP cyclohydrolase II [Dongiaceae bacterium]